MVKKIKKKRGRPPKKAPAQKKVTAQKKVKKSSTRLKKSSTECARGSKAVRKSKDKNFDKPKLPKRPRGNPNFIKKRKPTECTLEPSPTLKVFKVLGYCSDTDCNGIVTTGDYEDKKKGTICCASCGKRQKVTKLRESIEKPSKESSRNVRKNDLDEIVSIHDEVIKDIPDIPEEFLRIKIGEEWD